MSIVTYNGVQLPYPLTTRFSQDSVYEDSQTNRILTRFDISVQCVIHPAYVQMLAPSLAGTQDLGPATLMDTIRELLLEQRQALSFKVNNVEMIPPPPAGNQGTVDAKNGPQPQSCQIVDLTNSTFLLTYHIIAHYWEPENVVIVAGIEKRSAAPATLSSRWSESVDIDDNNYTTKTRNGVVIIRSDNPQGLTVDQVRNTMAVVGVPQGFLRKSSNYTVDPSGLALRYTVIDQEVFRMPPPTAFTAKGRLHVSTTIGAARYTIGCTVTLKSQKSQPQQSIAGTALVIAMSKVFMSTRSLQGGGGLKLAVIQSGTMDVELWENQVTVGITVLATKTPGRVDGIRAANLGGVGSTLLGLAGTIIGSVGASLFAAAANQRTADGIATFLVDAFDGADFGNPDSCGQYGPKPPYTLRGTANILLQAAAYYDPTVGATITNESVTATNIGIPLLPATPQTPGAISQTTTNSQLSQGALVGTAGKTGG